MKPILRLLDLDARKLYGTQKVFAEVPPTFEKLRIPHWLVLYEATLPSSMALKDNLTLTAAVKDRALIFCDGNLCGALSRSHNVTKAHLKPSKEIKLLVENQGRINSAYDNLEDFKVSSNIKKMITSIILINFDTKFLGNIQCYIKRKAFVTLECNRFQIR